jgi:citrate/tricarballylate utilization protein
MSDVMMQLHHQPLSALTGPQAEAERLMTICNACRYCEGLCAVFPAMELRREFPSGDLNYLANLCHNCGACYYDCQFATPHEFAVNMPQTLAAVRDDSYATYAWPPALAGTFAKNGLVISLVCALSVALFFGALMAVNDPAVMFGRHQGPGAFYRIMPHGAMVTVFGAAFLYAMAALVMGCRLCWRDMALRGGSAADSRSFWGAIKDAGRLRYLDGGGVGCMNQDDKPRDNRRLFHHLTFYGFGLCFASTCVATLYAYVFGWHAPYQIYDVPVVLGTLGGLGLVIGPIGLWLAKTKRDAALIDNGGRGMDIAFIAMLLLVSLTGLLLLVLRATPAMATVLALHLGFVFGFFITMPYSKFVHGLYRFIALVKYAGERAAAVSSQH